MYSDASQKYATEMGPRRIGVPPNVADCETNKDRSGNGERNFLGKPLNMSRSFGTSLRKIAVESNTSIIEMTHEHRLILHETALRGETIRGHLSVFDYGKLNGAPREWNRK